MAVVAAVDGEITAAAVAVDGEETGEEEEAGEAVSFSNLLLFLVKCRFECFRIKIEIFRLVQMHFYRALYK
jgi:hypothetical protein